MQLWGTTSAYDALKIGLDVTLTMSVPLRGDNKTHQSTIWQLEAAEVSAKSLRRRRGSCGETQRRQRSVDSPPVCEILITLNNLLI